jgi:6-phosphogluconolactonase
LSLVPVVVMVDVDAAARAAAGLLAWSVRQAAVTRGAATLALSGGSSVPMFAELGRLELPWDVIVVVQVDERLAPEGDPARNLTAQRRTLPDAARLSPMPVDPPDPVAYAPLVEQLDVVHLGMGEDGHTASLVPDDPVLDEVDLDVAMTGEYRGHRRMTLTYRALDRAGAIVWLVTGADKADALRRLVGRDPGIPAGRVAQDRAIVVADEPAASRLDRR